jgi:hypothetical protein
MRLTRTIVTLMVVSAGAGAAAGPAAALQPGVFLDPSSPAGKEYAFPLDTQRGIAAGHPNPPQGVDQPLFGVGIGPAGAGAGGSISGGSARVSSGSRSGASGSAQHRPNATRGRRANRTSHESSGQSPLNRADIQELAHPRGSGSQIALIALPVILGGLLVGAAIAVTERRRRA